MKKNEKGISFEKLPSVTVIVPVFNAEKQIAFLIRSLLQQNYPKDKFEIIIVDNNSYDGTTNIVREYSVKLLIEKDIQSSYVARNRGVVEAQYDILAFIDADCVADPYWLKNGIEVLMDQKADLVGGRIRFQFSERKTWAELYDSITSMQNEFCIKNANCAVTANLFVKKNIFSELGYFPRVRSGGDFQWTSRAVRNNYKLVYAPDAVVDHPTRSFLDLLKKNIRTGKGIPYIWLGQGVSMWKHKYLIRKLFPPSPRYIKSLIQRNTAHEMNKNFWGIWSVRYFCEIFNFLGIIQSLVIIIFKKYFFRKESILSEAK